MSNQMPPRGPLSDALVEHLRNNLDVLVGDQSRPTGSGWSGLQPGQGTFTASVEVSTGDATPGFRETVLSRHSSWVMTYGLSSVGGTRSQADHTADQVRAAAVAFPRGAYTDGWRVLDVLFARQAPVRKSDPTDHPSFHIDDVLEVLVERQRA